MVGGHSCVARCDGLQPVENKSDCGGASAGPKGDRGSLEAWGRNCWFDERDFHWRIVVERGRHAGARLRVRCLKSVASLELSFKYSKRIMIRSIFMRGMAGKRR